MEIANIKYDDGNYRLSLEKVDSSETEYRFAWRGNKKSKDGFINNPAYFDWAQLGKLIRRGFDSGEISELDIQTFITNLFNWNNATQQW